jgi:hypothetical protein
MLEQEKEDDADLKALKDRLKILSQTKPPEDKD